MMEFAKLLTECEVLCCMDKKDIQAKNFVITDLEPAFKKLMQTAENTIKQANLAGTNFYRIQMTIHSQKIEAE